MLEPSMFDVVDISIFPVHPIWYFFPLIGIVSDHPISSSLLLSGIYLFKFSIFLISMIENVFPFLLETCFSAALLSSTVWGREPWRRGVLTPNMLPIDWAQQISLLVFVCCIRDILYLYLAHIIGHLTDIHKPMCCRSALFACVCIWSPGPQNRRTQRTCAGDQASLGGPKGWWTRKLTSFKSWGNQRVELTKQWRGQQLNL